MELKITKLNINNFRNINELELTFTNGVNEIVAENGKGKTNTLSAIMWCLFGKNIYDNKLFTISPIIDDVERNDITTNVKLVINDNYVVSRTYYDRKTTLQTGYIIDGQEQLVKMTQSQYNEELKEKFVDEETFKSLSNINYIPNLNWKDLKQMIFDLIGDVKDEEVLLRKNFELIEEQVKLMGIDKTQESLNISDKKANEDIKKYETEYQTLVNTKEKYVVNDIETEKLETRKKEIQEEIMKVNEIQKSITELNNQYQEKKNEYDKLNIDLQQNENLYNYALQTIEDYKKSYELNSTSTDVLRNNEIQYLQGKIDTLTMRIEFLLNQIKLNTERMEDVKAKGKELQAKEMKVENDTCNTCGQHLPEEMIEATLNKLKENQLKQLQQYQEEVNNYQTVIDKSNEELVEKVDEKEQLMCELDKVNTKEYVVEEENEKQKQIRVAREQKELEITQIAENHQLIMTKMDHIKEELKNIVIPENVLISDEKINELNMINEKLATTITLKKIEDDIVETNNKLIETRNQKLVLKNKLEEVSKFNNLKADLVRLKAKSYFKIADFKTREFTQDGVEQETFKICVDGIEYKELNTGKKIIVAIDLLNGIQKIKDIKVPIIADNIEQFTGDIEVEDTQLIIAKAVKGITELTLNKEN